MGTGAASVPAAATGSSGDRVREKSPSVAYWAAAMALVIFSPKPPSRVAPGASSAKMPSAPMFCTSNAVKPSAVAAATARRVSASSKMARGRLSTVFACQPAGSAAASRSGNTSRPAACASASVHWPAR